MAGAQNHLKNEQPREQRAESREKREERREGIEASPDHDGKEKREERIQTPKGRQRSPNEAARGGPTLFDTMPPGVGTSGGLISNRGQREESREKREERREKREDRTFEF